MESEVRWNGITEGSKSAQFTQFIKISLSVVGWLQWRDASET